MKRNATVAFKKIVGCVALVLALHYVLDEPTRAPLIRAALSHLNRAVLLVNRTINRTRLLLTSKLPKKADPLAFPSTLSSVFTPATFSHRPLLDNGSFERWDAPEHPVLQVWFSSLTVGPWKVIKKETVLVQHGEAAVKMSCDGEGHCGNVRQEIPGELLLWFVNRRLRASVWALSTVSGAPCVRIDDGIDLSSACLQDPTETWQVVTVEHTVNQDATRVLLIIDITRKVEAKQPLVYLDNASFGFSQLQSEPPSATAVTAPPLPLVSD
ncbi:MAG: hypothetical protein HY595_01450 [Candidatus Omnitrophica bacterium]|nr:hypothetical protein [Candidatus Omnitrophota bacterium]